jgi:pimeloyl-ACP methyl ester carboxylesterase
VEQILAALRRPSTYIGYAREAMTLAQCTLRYPFGLLDGVHTGDRPSGDAVHDRPILLVHGFGHNRSGWHVVGDRLRQAGFTSIHTLNYDPWRHDVAALAATVRERVELLRGVSGFDTVNVVGHSLGGVLLRWYVQEMGGEETVATAITVASPHAGTRLAAFVPTRSPRSAADLAPNSSVMRRLARGARPSAVRWFAFYSNLDALVQPAASARIDVPALNATNTLIKDVGHLSIMLSPALAQGIVAALEAQPVALAS